MSTMDEIRARAPKNLEQMVRVKLMLHLGREARISKERLSLEIFKRYTKTTDRQIRDAVATLQEAGELIVTDTDDGGYYYAGSVEEAERYLADIQSRMKKLEVKRNALMRSMQATFGRIPPREQMSLL